ncbi:MAG: tRNA pseudouridine(55) synthase TruB [Anaerolineae bacterium]
MYSGILNLAKPRGYSSHDVVNHLRRLTDERRIGHAGTLDPLARGVLVMCIGQATRLSEYIASGRKTYLATLRLGEETDTWDAEGRVIATHPWQGVQRATMEQALITFNGAIQQIPPMFSAVKHNGKALYKLARKGIVIEREPREVTIDSVEIVSWEPPSVVLRIACSGGTYIRAIAHDVGQALQVGAYLADLVRERSGSLTIETAVPLDELESAGNEGWQRYLLPMQAGLGHLSGVSVDLGQESAIRQGRLIALPTMAPTSLLYATNQSGDLFAILQPAANGLWQPHKVLDI